ncbi:hypothetical protein TNCV_1866161 [Trichonephila clavipes]|nr:hypothetical protein TNCV_1866161 [Trichonephila clavipes]
MTSEDDKNKKTSVPSNAKNASGRLLLEWSPTPPSRSALSHLHSDNCIVQKHIHFQEQSCSVQLVMCNYKTEFFRFYRQELKNKFRSHPPHVHKSSHKTACAYPLLVQPVQKPLVRLNDDITLSYTFSTKAAFLKLCDLPESWSLSTERLVVLNTMYKPAILVL